jgi:fructuronate reductase
MRWQGGRDDAGAAFTVDDPLAPRTAAALAGADSSAARVDALLAIETIFSPALTADADVRAALVRHLAALENDGARAALASGSWR